MTATNKFCIILILSAFATLRAFAQETPTHPQAPPATTQTTPETGEQAHDGEHSDAHGAANHAAEEHEFDAGDNAVHHIGDANTFHVVGDLYIPLPCILYAPSHGLTVLPSSSKFEMHHHGNGEKAIDGYVLRHGEVNRVADPAFPKGEVAVGEFTQEIVKDDSGKEKERNYVEANGQKWLLDKKSTLDGGVMGGGITSFYDFSITKNVFSMILACLFMFLMFTAAARAYAKRQGMAPKGLQNFLEPFYLFIRDDLAKPIIGPHYEKYMPYLMSAFFFVLGLNLLGQLPFFPGSANVTGNISVTLVLAVITFLITNLSGNKHYWGHILWMPGVPALLKILITPLEILGIFLKPITLMLRLFANIAAGHIVILCFVSLIFILGKSGTSMAGTVGGFAMSIPLTLMMMALELLVAFLQAYIFTMLSATYFGAAVEEAHH